MYDIMIRRENEKKDSVYYYTSSHRNGLEVMNFFFDLINQYAGYSEKYYEEMSD